MGISIIITGYCAYFMWLFNEMLFIKNCGIYTLCSEAGYSWVVFSLIVIGYCGYFMRQ